MELIWVNSRLTVSKNGKMIVLKSDVIQAIKDHQNLIMEHIMLRHEEIVDLVNNTRVTITLYKDNVYVNLRDWFVPEDDSEKLIPTKRGVILTPSEWSQLLDELCREPISHFAIAKESFKACLSDNIAMLKHDQCHGCQIDHGSQRQHTCLGQDYYGNPISDVDAYSFMASKNITLEQYNRTFIQRLCGEKPTMNPVHYLAYCSQEHVMHELLKEL